MTRALVSELGVTANRDAVDLDLRTAKQRRTNRGARRLVSSKPLRVHLVHRLEVGEVREEHGRLRDTIERGVGRDEDRGEVVEHAPGLGTHVVAADQLAGLRIKRELSRAKHQIARDDRLAVRSDRRGCAVRFGGAKIHLLPLSRARR